MIELRALIRLRLQQWRHRLELLLRLFGYNPHDRSLKEFFYNLYLLAFFLVWFVFGAWGAILHQTAQIGSSLSPALWEPLLVGLPWAFFAIIVGLSLRYARRTPLVLAFPDMAHIAGSPVSRSIITLVQFGQMALQSMVLVLPAAAVTAVLLAQPLAATIGYWAAARAVIATIPLTLLVLGIAWLWGIGRLSNPTWSQWQGYGWLPLLLILAAIWPKLALWPGQLWVNALLGSWTLGQMAILVLLIGMLLLLLAWVGNRANLITVADESTLYARMQALGAFARLSPTLSSDLRSIQQQKRGVGKRPFLSLPTSPGTITLLTRSGLILFRQGRAPFALAAWGAIFTAAAQYILASATPPEFWLFWLFGLLLFPPQQVAIIFQADLHEPFLRQFLPLSLGRLLVMDTAVPFTFLLLGALGVWLAQPVLSPVLIIFAGTILTLCQSINFVPVTRWRVRIPYQASSLVTIGGTVAAGLFMGGWAAYVVAGTAVFVLSILVAHR